MRTRRLQIALVVVAVGAMTGAHAQPGGATADLPRAWTAAQVDAASSPLSRVEGAASNTHAVPAFGDAKSYAIPAAEVFGFAFLLNQVNRHTDGTDFDSNTSTIRRNLHSSWVVDRDPFAVNQLGHPYQGSMYHAFARSAGLDYWESLGYAFAGSALWEIAGESTLPSRNDQINTGIGGSFLGEILFRLANLTLEHDDLPPLWRETAAGFISPSTAFNRLAFGDRFKGLFPSRNAVYFSRLQIGFSGSAQNQAGTSTTKLRRNEALVDYSIDYGLPGKRGYTYDRPFDYFSLQATASSANGAENLLTRGLLVGRAYDVGNDYRGVFGLYGIYDYIAPQTFRVSSTAAALGTTAQWRAGEDFAVQGTALIGAGYTAVGTTRSTTDSDYHYGVSPQGLAALRFIFGERAALDLTAREYFVSDVGAASRGGHDNIVRLDASFTVRVYKRHGVSVRYLLNRRDASYPDVGDSSQTRGTIGLFYTYLGHDRFGLVD
ncbi:MAG: DUF3943 domain-containing protein [Betaproteobacteria bacterium]